MSVQATPRIWVGEVRLDWNALAIRCEQGERILVQPRDVHERVGAQSSSDRNRRAQRNAAR
jgi:hypothetical protein